MASPQCTNATGNSNSHAFLTSILKRFGGGPFHRHRGESARHDRVDQLELIKARLADLNPGAEATCAFKFTESGITRVHLDVMRPTGFSALTEIWKA